MRDFRDAKTMARALRDVLKAKGVETTHSESLELIATAFGYVNWNILSAKIEAAEAPASEQRSPSAAGTQNDPTPPKTLYCSFCGKSQHEVQKLIAGPGVFICDECVDLCTGIVDDDTELFRLMKGNDETGGQADPALFELARGTSTKELAHYAERGRKGVERNRLLRVAIYAKGASIYQRSDARDPTSTDDEIAKCIRCCRDKGWEVVETYTDAGTKGTPHRELEQMLEDAAAGKFDIVVATAMNRFSRNLSDIVEATAMNRFSRNLSDMFSLFKRLWAEDVCVFTLAEDFVTPLPSAVLNRMRDEDR